MKIQFDYTVFPIIDGNSKVIEIIHKPYIPVNLSSEITGKHTKSSIMCLLDSGADKNLFPVELAKSLGISLKEGAAHTMIGIGGIMIQSYSHKVSLSVRDYTFEADVFFSADQQTPLLGREGFFSAFHKVTFDQHEFRVELEYKNSDNSIHE